MTKPINKLGEYGEKIGIAFQIKDDLFDYGDDEIGKPRGIDIKEKKMTLPLIYALQNSSRTEKSFIINTVKNHNEDKKKSRLDQMIKDKGWDGICYQKNGRVQGGASKFNSDDISRQSGKKITF